MNDVTSLLRGKVFEAEAVMRARGERVEMPPKHHFSDGVYGRELTIPAGTIATGKIHKRQSMFIVMSGVLHVALEDHVERIEGPRVIVSPPGTKRMVYAETDVVCMVVHGTHETDVAKIEKEFIAQTEQEYLGAQAQLKEVA